MNENKKIKILPLLFFLSVFTIIFFIFINNHKVDVVDKNFHNFDESINGTVTANLTRKIFPPMVRLNPLIEEQTTWMEGPYWQHLPPLYMYIPLPFFSILNNGIPSAEIIRISYITIMFLAVLLFISAVYFWERKIIAILSATLASIILIQYTDFAQSLMLGFVFNHSDMVLFFSVISSFFAIGWYLQKEKEDRLKYSLLKISVIALIVTLPIVIKTVLGAIPLVTFLFLILKDRRKIFDKKIIFAFLIPLAVIVASYLPLYLVSPDVFWTELMLPIDHISGKEGDINPWHFYVTSILPNKYFAINMYVFYSLFILSLYQLYKVKLSRRTKNILLLSSIWFIWNLVAISFSLTKIPNFIFQSYILFLFFIIYSVILFASRMLMKINWLNKNILIIHFFRKPIIQKTITSVVFLSAIFYSASVIKNVVAESRKIPELNSKDEQFRNFSEAMRDNGVSTKDLTILYTAQIDCCSFKYYVLFNTGAESYDFQKVSDVGLDIPSLKRKYNSIHIVLRDSITDTSNFKIPHKTTPVRDFSVVTIKSSDLPATFNEDLKQFIESLPYIVNEKIY